VNGARVELGLGGIEGSCWAAETRSSPGLSLTELHVVLHGGVLGDAWADCTWGGFGETAVESIVSAVHAWIEGPFQALASAFGGGSIEALPIDVAGRRCRVFASPWNVRGVSGAGDALREALGARPLVLRLVEQGALPLLEPGYPLLVSSFVARYGDQETVEVKIHGTDWPIAAPALRGLPWPDGDDYLSLRELAVLWPEPGPLALPPRAALERTLAALAAADPDHAQFGAARHHYELAPPLAAETVARIEARAGVSLPDDYRSFVLEIGAGGAGPFHGLLPPDNEAQLAGVKGPFPYAERWMPRGDESPDLRGVLTLAHVGCGYASFLVVDGPSRGEVWADRGPADEGLVRTHPSFTAWYSGWIFDLLANRPQRAPITPGRCAFPDVISQFLRGDLARRGLPPDSHDIGPSLASLGPGTIVTSTSSDRYFEPGQPIDVCPSCAQLARNLDIPLDRFVPGEAPKQAGSISDRGNRRR
jgi:hypothetical protein